jgi:hypothetical protein
LKFTVGELVEMELAMELQLQAEEEVVEDM